MQFTDDPLLEDTIDLDSHSILLAAAHHDNSALKSLLRAKPATARDAETGFTALHAAIAACEPQKNEQNETFPNTEVIGQAEATVKLLLEHGAIWNDLDSNNETPGCLAWRLGLKSLYALIVDAGVRAEILLNRLDAFAPLQDSDEEGQSGDHESEEQDQAIENAENADRAEGGEPNRYEALEDDNSRRNLSKRNEATDVQREAIMKTQAAASALSSSNTSYRATDNGIQATEVKDDFEVNLSNQAYLSTRLSIQPGRILDADASGVMMSWETALMERTADLIAKFPKSRILNIGHGMGIIDNFFASKSPAKHAIVEAHPDVLEAMEMPVTGFKAKYPSSTILRGSWQDVLPKLIEEGETFDAIFFDTYAEDYAAFREFFTEYVIGLLAPEGRWSFFMGMGADRRVCYDVYTKVAEIDLEEAGFDVEWEQVPTPDLDTQYEGVRRKYFAVSEYRLPVCRFVS